MRLVKYFLFSLSLLVAANVFAKSATQWMPITVERGLVVIDVKINGHSAKAMLDTGAESNAVSKAFLETNSVKFRKGDPLVLTGVYGQEKANFVNGLEIELLGNKLAFDNLIPMSGNPRFDVILGMPFFHSLIVQLDYPNQKMRLASRDSINLKDFANVKLKSNESKSQLVTPVIIDGFKVDLLFDTGNSGGILLHRPFAERKGWIEKYKQTEAKSSGVVSKSVAIDILSLPEMQFGPFTLEDILVSIPEEGKSKRLRNSKRGLRDRENVNYRGILGYDILKHFVLTLDARRGLPVSYTHLTLPTIA